MASIRKEMIIEAPADHVWHVLRDVGAVHTRLARQMVLDTRLEGNDRLVTFANGEVVRERIVTVDEKSRRVVYAVVNWHTTHHNASFQVMPDGESRSRLIWITDLLPDTLTEMIGGFVEQGCAAIKQTLESDYKRQAEQPATLR
jgi:hypothetical protein